MVTFEELNLPFKIKQIRELKNLSKEYVAGELNIEPRTYSNIESGTVNITVKRLYELCKIFECQVEEILKFDHKNIFNFNVMQENGNLGSNINYQEVKNEKVLLIELLKAKNDIIDLLRLELKG